MKQRETNKKKEITRDTKYRAEKKVLTLVVVRDDELAVDADGVQQVGKLAASA